MAGRKAVPRAEIQLAEVDNDIVACRASRHQWPSDELQPGKALPRGFRPVLLRDGTVLIEEPCRRCGKRVSYLTGTGGSWQPGAKRRYVDPEHWKTFRIETGITKSDFRGELYRRMNESIMAAAERNLRTALARGEDL